LPVLRATPTVDSLASGTVVFASTVKPFASRDCIIAPKRVKCWLDKMPKARIDCSCSRGGGKVGRLVGRSGRKRPCCQERKFCLSHAEAEPPINHAETETLIASSWLQAK
jgi:hypothetical protein